MKLTSVQRQRVEENLGLVGKVIRDKVRGINQMGIFDFHDLFQIGCLGLCKAVMTDRGGNFSTYAYRLIWNEICDALIYATKRQETELKILDMPGFGAVSDPLEQIILQAEVQNGIARARKAANPSTKKGIDALVLHARGYSCSEIGAEMHAAPNLVTAWMAKAKQYLRRQPELQRAIQLVNA
ncbi:MAG: sigma-70 family RNA polymerase sigma factor [Oscillospiraceae bacterium]|nr:sigma-70 family RNA polymerase sigma factor [Oscillospiraceae bacterium]MBR0160786.1 sigma-70 family RNA polymerase sigma factor [Oscillospiraceae bacterium]